MPQGNTIEEVVADATAKGMYCVDENNPTGVHKEFDECCKEVDALCENVDPEATPYKSKYEARKKLDVMVNKLEASKTIASLEKKKEQFPELHWRLGHCRVRLGTISWEVEEPHHAQADLELAVNYYTPEYVEDVIKLVGPEEDEGVEKPLDAEWVNSLVPPPVNLPSEAKIVDAMKCFNMLGILWAGRGVVPKSLLYLLASKTLYEENKKQVMNDAKTHDSVKREFESAYTHNLFYLAQAYGHLGDAIKSSQYCHETLERQLASGFSKNETNALEWAKNCVGISDFFQVMGMYQKCSLALLSARAVLDKATADAEQYDAGDLEEQNADLNRRLANLDVLVFKRSFERALALQEARMFAEQGEPEKAQLLIEQAMADVDAVSEGEEVNYASGQATALAKAGDTVFGSSSEASLEFFKGLSVNQAPYLLDKDIDSFDDAKTVYLRASQRIEEAKKFYLLDGHVSDHVHLLQQQSKLYHYLATFETEPKRKLAMETRRATLLLPMLKTLSRASFEGLHKQISYELGETYLTLLDTKVEKLRAKHPQGIVDPRQMKSAEISNCNNYVRGGLAMFSHYISFFLPIHLPDGKENPLARGPPLFRDMALNELAYSANAQPDEETISKDEIRSFLNAHFMSARLLSRVIIAPDTPQNQRATYMVACLKRYEMLAAVTEPLCAKKGVEVQAVFAEELGICKDMVELLPSKIERIHRMGENPIL